MNAVQPSTASYSIELQDAFLPLILHATISVKHDSDIKDHVRYPSPKVAFLFTGCFSKENKKYGDLNLGIGLEIPSLKNVEADSLNRCGIFQDLVVEIFHDGGDPNVYIRIFNDGNTNSVNWNNFTSANMKFSLMKPITDEDDKEVKQYETKLIKNFKCSNSCERIQCECKQERNGFCAVAKLCSVTELLNFILNTTLYSCRFKRKIYLLSRMSLVLSADPENPSESDLLYEDESKLAEPTIAINKVLENINAVKFDFSLMSGGRRFRCHKFILAGKSNVFAKMFDSGMLEANTNEMSMANVSDEGVELFIDFLYTGNVGKANDDTNLALELLLIGHKYEMVKLQNVMKELLISKSETNFDFDTTIKMFAFSCNADNLEDLQCKAVEILKTKGNEFVDSEEFKELLKSDPFVVKELFRKILS